MSRWSAVAGGVAHALRVWAGVAVLGVASPAAWAQASAPASAPASQPAVAVNPKVMALRPDEWDFWDQARAPDAVLDYLAKAYDLTPEQVTALREPITRLVEQRNAAMPEYLAQRAAIDKEMDAWRDRLVADGRPDREAFRAIMDKELALKGSSPASPLAILDCVEAAVPPAQLLRVYQRRSTVARQRLEEIRRELQEHTPGPAHQSFEEKAKAAREREAAARRDEEQRRQRGEQLLSEIKQEGAKLEQRLAEVASSLPASSQPADSQPASRPATALEATAP